MQNAESQRRAEGMKKWGLNAHVYFARGLDGEGEVGRQKEAMDRSLVHSVMLLMKEKVAE